MGRVPMREDRKNDEIVKNVILAQDGDRNAMSFLIENTQTRLFRFCVYLSRDNTLAEDICQEAYIKVLNKLKSLRDPKGFLPWLMKTAKNLYLDHIRSPRISRSVGIENLEKADPESKVGLPDLITEISTALSLLEPEDRLILLLIDQQRYSYTEAAKMIGISEAALTSRIHRIRKAFLEKYEGK